MTSSIIRQSMFDMTRATRAALCVLVATVALSGCSEARRALGYDKAPPDEFAVVSRAPLAVPPDFKLRPPEPGAVRPQEGPVRDQARQALLGRNAAATPARNLDVGGRSSGEVALLKRAGSDQAPADIRTLVNKETSALADASKSFTDQLVFWRKPEPYGTVIDPAKENQRLQENQALGKAVTNGETPIIKRRQKGILEGVF